MMKPANDGRLPATNQSRTPANAEPLSVLPAVFGRYRVLRLLGKGGMGAVYLAEDSQLGRQVALKIPFLDVAESTQRSERFVREARSAAMLQHPNICTVYDAGQIDGRPFITMALLVGKPLSDEIDPDRPMQQHRAAEIVRKLALALDHAHKKGTVHRDLKPANVMLSPENEPIIMDFGLAKRIADIDPGEVKLTRLGGIVGTPNYMAPEQVKGDGSAIGPATDVYSLGVVLFEMLTGRTPYSGSLAILMGQVLHAPVPPVREFRPDVDAQLGAICQKAMAKQPAARFQSMAAFATVLEQYAKVPATLLPAPITAVRNHRARLDGPAADVIALQAKAPETASARSLVIPPAPAGGHLPYDDLALTPAPATARKKSKRPQWGRPVILAGIVAALLTLLAFAGSVVLQTKTKESILVLEVTEANPKIYVDGNRVPVNWDRAGKKAEIHLEPGSRKVEVKKEGFSEFGEQVTLEEGNRRIVVARLEQVKPRQPPVVKEPPPPLVKEGSPPPPREKEVTNAIGLRLVRIPAGTFSMGTPSSEGSDSERPEHPVEITKEFHLGVYEVTQKQFEAVMGYNPSYFSRNGGGKLDVEYLARPAGGRGMLTAQDDPDSLPVENVSWNEAVSFCEKLSAMEKEKEQRRVYRLPTEAEWEYACRGGAGAKMPFHFGSRLVESQANFGNLQRTTEVGKYPPNGFGLYDMHGNVCEWCSDRYRGDYYADSPPSDPPGAGPGEGTGRVIRGGCWGSSAGNCRTGFRAAGTQEGRVNRYGFRILLVPLEKGKG